MPAADTEQKRTGLPLLPGLLWAGVGLAPVAALLALFAGDSFGLIRVAIVLAVIALALIGASMALRNDSDSVRSQVEDMVFEELDIMRDDLRADITTAARATHKAVGERVVTLQESVDALRGQFDNLRSQVHRAPAQSPPMPQQQSAPQQQAPPPNGVSPVASGHGVVRHTETVKVTTRSTIVDNNDNATNRSGTVYGSRPPEPAPAQRRGSEYGAAATYPANGPDQTDSGSWTEQLLRERLGDEPFSDGYGINAERPRDRMAAERPGERALAERFGADPGDRADRFGSDRGDRRDERYGSDRGERRDERADRRDPYADRRDDRPRDDRPRDDRPRDEPPPRSDAYRSEGYRSEAYRSEAYRSESYRSESGPAARENWAADAGRPDRSERGTEGWSVQDRYDAEGRYDQPGRSAGAGAPGTYGGRADHSDAGATYSGGTDYPGFAEPGPVNGRRAPEPRPGEDVRGGGRRRAVEPDDRPGDRITGVSAGDRWASVRSDDRGGRELRMGERRSDVRADGGGTEMRIEDRWAAVRRQDAGHEQDWGRGTEWNRGNPPDVRWPEPDPPRWEDPQRRALPAQSSEPSAAQWAEGWTANPEPISDRVNRRAPRPPEEDDERYRRSW